MEELREDRPQLLHGQSSVADPVFQGEVHLGECLCLPMGEEHWIIPKALRAPRRFQNQPPADSFHDLLARFSRYECKDTAKPGGPAPWWNTPEFLQESSDIVFEGSLRPRVSR